MNAESHPNSDLILNALATGKSRDEIKLILLDAGVEERYAVNLIKEVTKLYRSKKLSQGLVLISIGAVCCFVSCVSSLIFFSQGAFAWTLYGFTTVGIAIMFVGFAKVF